MRRQPLRPNVSWCTCVCGGGAVGVWAWSVTGTGVGRHTRERTVQLPEVCVWRGCCWQTARTRARTLTNVFLSRL
jgi:hypothetical protein